MVLRQVCVAARTVEPDRLDAGQARAMDIVFQTVADMHRFFRLRARFPERLLEDPLAEFLLTKQVEKGGTVRVDYKGSGENLDLSVA